jgi:hypothetical protein
MARCYLSQCLDQFLALLITYQGMHPQNRAIDQHVLYEDSLWMNAFNLHINLSSIFDALYGWFPDPASNQPVDYHFSQPTGGESFPLLTAGQVLDRIIISLCSWHSTYVYKCISDVNVPVSLVTIASMVEPEMNHVAVPQMQAITSFHLILHRFYADSLRELFQYPHHVDTIHQHLQNPILASNLHVLMMQPLEVLGFASDISAGLWIKNGRSMFDQLLNYQDPPFSRIFRSLDLFFIQLMLMAALNHQKPLLLIPLALKCLNGTEAMKTHVLESLFLILIHILQELPSNPANNAQDRVIPQIKRALVHRLAQGSCVYSQLIDACNHIPNHLKVS